ncbi:MAG TPA: NAD(P)H-binding protein [Rugosimonospora sp.]|nr:NAD(P)H-binding protein [Rugosimonospora sp.]
MRLTVVAATGGIGRQLVDQALAAGHEVTALVRNPRDLPGPVRVVRADLSRPEAAAVEAGVRGADAVLSGLGPSGPREAGIASTGTRALVEAMWTSGVKRIVVVSAAPVGTVPVPGEPPAPKHDPGDTFLMRHLLSPMVKRLFPKVYADLAGMEALLRDTALDWTVVRPPRLTNGPLTAAYRTAVGRNVRRGNLVSRADVAHLMLASLDRPETIHQVLGIAN